MASAVFSLEFVNESLSEDGFFAFKDLAVGDSILEMEKRASSFSQNMAWIFANNTSSMR
jgi:hypothetical protein